MPLGDPRKGIECSVMGWFFVVCGVRVGIQDSRSAVLFKPQEGLRQQNALLPRQRTTTGLCYLRQPQLQNNALGTNLEFGYLRRRQEFPLAHTARVGSSYF
jgi:hypothetical protein